MIPNSQVLTTITCNCKDIINLPIDSNLGCHFWGLSLFKECKPDLLQIKTINILKNITDILLSSGFRFSIWGKWFRGDSLANKFDKHNYSPDLNHQLVSDCSH